jgi:hypothetical protein
MSVKNYIRALSVLCIAAFVCACGHNSVSPDQTRANTPSVAQLSGTFVFSATGTDPSDGDYFVAGSITADGSGGITGVEDLNLGSGIDSDVTFKGTYQVDPGGNVTVNLADTATNGSFFTFPLPSGSSPVKISYNSTGSGTLQPQSVTGFSNAGTFNFTLTGEGEGTVTGSGSFTTNAAGGITAGSEQYQDGTYSRSTAALTGELSPAFSGGRGTAVIGSNLFSYYVVSQKQIILAGLEDLTLIDGSATKQ